MHANKAIRDAAKAQIEAVYTTGVVFTGRTADIRTSGAAESVQIFLSRGSEQGDSMQEENRAELKIIVRKAGIVHDDELDAIAAQVHAAMVGDMTLGGAVYGIAYDSFEYLDDDATSESSALALTYLVIH